MFFPLTGVEGQVPGHLACGLSKARASCKSFVHTPQALQSGCPFVLGMMDFKPNTHPAALNRFMPYLATNFLTLFCLWRSESWAHSMDKEAPTETACAARRFQPFQSWSCSFQRPNIFDRVAAPLFQLGPPGLLKEQPAVHGEEYHKWQFLWRTQRMTSSTVDRFEKLCRSVTRTNNMLPTRL